jgi:hypothetical protein
MDTYKTARANGVEDLFSGVKRELTDVLSQPASGHTIGVATAIGNKCLFALQILDDSADYTNQTITMEFGKKR